MTDKRLREALKALCNAVLMFAETGACPDIGAMMLGGPVREALEALAETEQPDRIKPPYERAKLVDTMTDNEKPDSSIDWPSDEEIRKAFNHYFYNSKEIDIRYYEAADVDTGWRASLKWLNQWLKERING